MIPLMDVYEIIILTLFGSGTIFGGKLNMMHVASMTILTPSGGFFSDLTSTMSAFVRFFNDERAFSRAGIA